MTVTVKIGSRDGVQCSGCLAIPYCRSGPVRRVPGTRVAPARAVQLVSAFS
jgi:hypothetical protein